MMPEEDPGLTCSPDCPTKESGGCYSNHGCRCQVCKTANTRRVQKRRHERAYEEVPQDKHGRDSTYVNWGCRCDPCTKAHSDACADWRKARGL